MAKKLDTTPDGIICHICGKDKPRYHYFKHSGKYNQNFFTTPAGYTDGICFECAAPYRCIQCHEIKPASEFRIQGRICIDCKNAEPDFLAHVTDAILDVEGISSHDSAKTLENGGDE